MWNLEKNLKGLAASAAAALAAAGIGGSALAGGDIAADGLKSSQYRDAEVADIGHHESVIQIKATPGTKVRKDVHIGLGKSVMLEFDQPVRDVMVSNPQAVDAVVLSSNRIFLLARRFGESNAFIFDASGEQLATLEVYVERETSALETLLKRLIPGSNIKVEMLNQTVILTGSVKTPVDANRATTVARQFVQVEYESKVSADAEGVAVKKVAKDDLERVINMLAVEGEEQVMLRVVVAEVQRSILKQFGINMAAEVSAGSLATSIMTQNALPLTSAAGLGNLGDAVRDNTAAVGQGCNVNLPSVGGDFVTNSGPTGVWTPMPGLCLAYTMRVLEREGLVKTLAEPNLTAISGEAAKFLAGGEYPIPVVDSDGALTVTYKEFGVGVAFTPTVMSEGRISLKIETEVSELTNTGAVTLSNIQIPALKKRTANSTVELPSGGSLAMAGLISDDTRQNIDGLPGMKDVPILGTLFRSRDFIKQETELVVIVTPYLVRPTARQELARPLDGLGDPTDMKANFLGHLNRVYGKGEAAPAGDLKGDYGFIVE